MRPVARASRPQSAWSGHAMEEDPAVHDLELKQVRTTQNQATALLRILAHAGHLHRRTLLRSAWPCASAAAASPAGSLPPGPDVGLAHDEELGTGSSRQTGLRSTIDEGLWTFAAGLTGSGTGSGATSAACSTVIRHTLPQDATAAGSATAKNRGTLVLQAAAAASALPRLKRRAPPPQRGPATSVMSRRLRVESPPRTYNAQGS